MSINNDICEKENVQKAIMNTVTSQDVITVAQKITGDPTIQVVNYELSPYSSNKLGYLGSHRQLKITIKKTDSSNTKELYLFVKSVPYEHQDHTTLIINEGIFFEEYFYYKEIEQQLLKTFKGEKWSADCYLVKKDCLIMEDLRLQGYRSRDKFFNCILELKSALAAVARFHSCSILLENRLKKNLQDSRSLNEIYVTAFKEKTFNNQSKVYCWVTAGIDVIRAIATKFDLSTDNLTRIYDHINNVIKPSLIHRNVINHGDLWWNNIMFDDSKPLPKCRLVDYQILRYAPLVLDILMLIYVHTSRDYRKAHENELIEFYHSIFTESIKSSDELAAVPSLEDVRFAYEDLRIFGPALTNLVLPTHLIETEILNDRVKDSEGLRKHIFGDRIDVTLTEMEQNEVFKNRMIEGVQEMVELGKLI